MALARLALKKLQQRVVANGSSSSSLMMCHGGGGVVKNQRWGNELLLRRFATKEGSEVAVSSSSSEEGKKKSKLFSPRRRGGRRPSWPWRSHDHRHFSPALYEFFPSGLGNALMQATENINKLFQNMNVTPWSLSGSLKEKDDHYKLRYEMPGISKEDVKITIDDGVLTIKGEHKEEKEEKSDDADGENDEYWSSSSYGYYNTSLVLPEDAKVDEVKAELKDGVLIVTIPRSERPKKDVKYVTID